MSEQKSIVIAGDFDPITSDDLEFIRDLAAQYSVIVLLSADQWVAENKKVCQRSWLRRARLLRGILGVTNVVEADSMSHVMDIISKMPNIVAAVPKTTPETEQFIAACHQVNVPIVSVSSNSIIPNNTPQQKINIVCLKWGSKYGPDYVNKLFGAVKRNSTVDFRFICYSDDQLGIRSEVEVHPLQYRNITSWWNKLYLFSTELDIPIGDKIFYIDLDTLITGNIDHLLLAETNNKILVLEDFYNKIASSSNNIGSGLMAWTHGAYDYLWKLFIKDPESAVKAMHPYGDQYWVQTYAKNLVTWQSLYPEQITSFKVHCRNGLPPDARVVCYHGKPSIPDSACRYMKDWKWEITPQRWVLDYWREE